MPAIISVFDIIIIAIIISYLSKGKWPVHTGIGRTQPAVDGRRPCTVCVPLQSVCIPFQSVLGRNPVVEAVPIQTETVCKWTEAVRKRCKDGVRLQQAESVLCLCVWAIFPAEKKKFNP